MDAVPLKKYGTFDNLSMEIDMNDDFELSVGEENRLLL